MNAAAAALALAGLLSADSRPTNGDTPRLHGAWAYDFTDDRYVVGAADYVFFGLIVSTAAAPPLQPETADDGDLPWLPRTAYLVHALADIKGDLSTRTQTFPSTDERTTTAHVYTMLQVGGVGPGGVLEFFEDDGPLVVGGIYLLITREIEFPPGPLVFQTGVSQSAISL